MKENDSMEDFDDEFNNEVLNNSIKYKITKTKIGKYNINENNTSVNIDNSEYYHQNDNINNNTLCEKLKKTVYPQLISSCYPKKIDGSISYSKNNVDDGKPFYIYIYIKFKYKKISPVSLVLFENYLLERNIHQNLENRKQELIGSTYQQKVDDMKEQYYYTQSPPDWFKYYPYFQEKSETIDSHNFLLSSDNTEITFVLKKYLRDKNNDVINFSIKIRNLIKDVSVILDGWEIIFKTSKNCKITYNYNAYVSTRILSYLYNFRLAKKTYYNYVSQFKYYLEEAQKQGTTPEILLKQEYLRLNILSQQGYGKYSIYSVVDNRSAIKNKDVKRILIPKEKGKKAKYLVKKRLPGAYKLYFKRITTYYVDTLINGVVDKNDDNCFMFKFSIENFTLIQRMQEVKNKFSSSSNKILKLDVSSLKFLLFFMNKIDYVQNEFSTLQIIVKLNSFDESGENIITSVIHNDMIYLNNEESSSERFYYLKLRTSPLILKSNDNITFHVYGLNPDKQISVATCSTMTFKIFQNFYDRYNESNQEEEESSSSFPTGNNDDDDDKL